MYVTTYCFSEEEIDIRYIGIDPASTTGFVAMNKDGEVLIEKDIVGEGSEDPKRMVTLVDRIISEVAIGDIICIEGFSYQSRGRGMSFQFGLGHAIRNKMFSENVDYIDIAPSQLKKFATGKGNTSKDNMILPIYKKWNYEHTSDNVRDAYVLAQIAKGVGGHGEFLKYEADIIKELKE